MIPRNAHGHTFATLVWFHVQYIRLLNCKDLGKHTKYIRYFKHANMHVCFGACLFITVEPLFLNIITQYYDHFTNSAMLVKSLCTLLPFW